MTSTGDGLALFWDIDGTLLTTLRAGVFALEAAVADVAGVELDLHGLETAGRTDAEIAAAALAEAGADHDDALVSRFLRSYERHLPDCLPRRQGHVMPGVREALEDFRARPGIRSYLLTGNTPQGARAKLEHYGLADYFSEGAFCVGPQPRSDIARRALALAQGARLTYVIGDTPQDIAAGAAIGVRTIAVATGPYSSQELATHEPWTVLERIPEPPAFRALLERG